MAYPMEEFLNRFGWAFRSPVAPRYYGARNRFVAFAQIKTKLNPVMDSISTINSFSGRNFTDDLVFDLFSESLMKFPLVAFDADRGSGLGMTQSEHFGNTCTCSKNGHVKQGDGMG